MTILLALMFALPGHAQMRPHDHAAPAMDMQAAMGHHHAMRAAGACGKACPVCAMTCCGAILPALALLPSGAAPRPPVFAAARQLGRGVQARLEPYPPRRTAQG